MPAAAALIEAVAPALQIVRHWDERAVRGDHDGQGFTPLAGSV
jgi:hypothetical protein